MDNFPSIPQLNPTNTELIKFLNDLDKRLGSLERVTQPDLINWYSYNPGQFSYNSADKISVSNMDATQFFQVGDKIRIKQLGVYIFLIITLVTTGYLYVSATNSGRLSNNDIQEIATSRLVNPTGYTEDLDWTYLTPALFSYSANNVLVGSSSIDVEDYFSVGDKVKLYQGSLKYFYVIRVDASTNKVYLDAGDDYTYTNSSITYIAKSSLTNPSGHPLEFKYTPTAWRSSGSTISITSVDIYYSLNGRTVVQTIDLYTSSFPSSLNSFYLESPFYISGTEDFTFIGSQYAPSVISGTADDCLVLYVEKDILGLDSIHKYINEIQAGYYSYFSTYPFSFQCTQIFNI